MKRLSKTILTTGLVVGVAFAGGSALADGAALYKTKTCIACHGAEGKAPILPTYPKLAGQNEQYLLNQMKDIKSGARNNGQTAAMKGVMHLVSDAEMAEIAKWLSGLK
ncbi:MAG: cytochrome c [Gammaproteobacteria bacterium]